MYGILLRTAVKYYEFMKYIFMLSCFQYVGRRCDKNVTGRASS
jgi:hypothetical protein